MQITNYDLFAVPPRWLLLKLETSDGLVGWGEPIIQGRLETIRAAVAELVEGYLIGTDPLRPEYHWRTLYQGGYYRGGPVLMSALAGIDQALWDIKGRHHGCPVYELLGGHVRDRVMVYQWVGGESAENMAEEAERSVDAGYRALKINTPDEFRPLETAAGVDRITERIAQIRERVGDDVLLGVDFHGRVSRPMAPQLLRRLEQFDLTFVDQPLLPEHEEMYGELAAQTSIPLASGERLYSRYDFKRLLLDGGVSVVQPDVTHAGGITEMKKILSLAESFDAVAVPHCPLSPVAFAASLQVDFCTHNAVLQEQDLTLHDPSSSIGLRYLDDSETFVFEDGYVERPTGDGLGIELDEEYVREQAKTNVNWTNPVWHHEDGSVAEW
ncbi:galactonate dehydratase [Halomarina pelagica]|uniref:galactonate dehydratase n=1 Tax=Halomarina pelagica TaxID=2961599 RepID=UPI0020C3638B|nr:galactonate dehydratase [Halomarina sp. BND7]